MSERPKRTPEEEQAYWQEKARESEQEAHDNVARYMEERDAFLKSQLRTPDELWNALFGDDE